MVLSFKNYVSRHVDPPAAAGHTRFDRTRVGADASPSLNNTQEPKNPRSGLRNSKRSLTTTLSTR